MYEIKKLQISSLAKISGIASGIFGLIPMVFSFLSILPNYFWRSSYSSYDSYETILPSLIILAIPLLAAIIGYIYGTITAFIYNLIVPYVGGIRMEIELIEENKQQ